MACALEESWNHELTEEAPRQATTLSLSHVLGRESGSNGQNVFKGATDKAHIMTYSSDRW